MNKIVKPYRPNLKAYISNLIVFILAILIITSCISTKDNIKKQKTTFLWKVTSGSTNVFLLGSIHLASKDIYPLNPEIEKAFSKSAVLVVEVDVEKNNGFDMIFSMMDRISYPPGESLKTNISKELYGLLKEELGKMGFDITMFNTLKPWVIAFLIETIQLTELGYKPEYGIDIHFLNKARGSKVIEELETLDYQLSLFEDLPNNIQVLYLNYTLTSMENREQYLTQIFNFWKTGKTKQLEDILLDDLNENPELEVFYEKILFKRNKNMVVKIEEYLKSDKICFIVVGAAHLVGDRGIVDILKKKGYSAIQY